MPIEHDVVTSVHRGGYVASSDPGAVGAYRFWTDTTTTPHVLKVRNAGNTAWVRVGEILTGSNIGTGAGVFKQKTGEVLEFRSIRGIGAVETVQSANDVSVEVVETLLDKTQIQGYFRESYLLAFSGASHPSVGANPISQYGGITWTRVGTGSYYGSFVAVLPVNGVIIQITPGSSGGNTPAIFTATTASPTQILIQTYNPNTFALMDVTSINVNVDVYIITDIPFLNQAAGFWGHFAPDSWIGGFDTKWSNKLNNPVTEAMFQNGTDVDQTGTLNGYPTVQFSLTTNDGVLTSQFAPHIALIREAFIVMKMREATFSNFAGIITNIDTSTSPLLVGDTGTTKFLDLGYTGQEYRLDGNLYANNNMQAPMNTWGLVHVRYSVGWGFTEMQFGRDRDFAGRFAEVDMAEVLLFSALQPQSTVDQIYEYLQTKYSI